MQVSGWQGGEPLGSALGEGPTAESAEDRALGRLIQRLANKTSPLNDSDLVETQEAESDASTNKRLIRVPFKKDEQIRQPNNAEQVSASEHQVEALTDPEDWSDELAAIDNELQRIGWDREQEMLYLQKCFGHSSRHRITRYSDLTSFLNQLKELKPGEDPNEAGKPLRRTDLLNQCDQLLEKLRWTPDQGRRYLQDQLKARSRQQLNDQQLLSFNMLLEAELITNSQ
ncbi:hypothetical protein EV13_0657 [Prochlorococcus sp. MIT 0702]|nr:hypothetical protein EV12_2548 [Prochlorococcus sp. MIT 0701]KGG30014.1 hypothetical protein EV13_0657 [Prochlorococcus sp. MIT 0702]KGG30996.1 hypothetical protein EV14_2937 [Prochlorococcus sp. MIT 0703]